MKNGSMRLMVIVGLVALVVCSWYMLIDNTQRDNQQYAAYLNTAREKAELGLSEVALGYYESAMDYRDSIELRDEVAQFYKDEFSVSNYEAFCELIIEDYPYEKVGYERMAQLYKELNEIHTCFTYIESAQKRGVQSEVLDEIVQELYYAYELLDNSAVVVTSYSANRCAVQRASGKWGYVNNAGGTSLSSQYLKASPFSSSGYAAVQMEDGTFALINTSGVPQSVDGEGKQIEDVTVLISNKMAVKYDGKYHYCDWTFKELFGAYDYAGAFYCGVAAVQNDGKWAIIDENGENVTDFVYEDVKLDDKGIAFRGNRALVKYKGEYILIDTEGDRIGSGAWSDADAFNADMIAAVEKDGKWGFINAEGEVEISYQYAGAQSFSNGYAAVKVEGKWGFIVTGSAELVIEAVFEEAMDFSTRGNVFVKLDEQWKLLRIYRLC